MANTTLNTRILQKYDTYTNWAAANPVLLKGEIAVSIVPASTGAVAQEPAILVKVGDGSTAYNDLPYLSAVAADVYDWAKASEKPSYTADEIENLSDYIAGEIEDTNSRYKIEQDADDGHILYLYVTTDGATWTLQDTITVPETVYTLTTGTTNGTVSFNGTEVAVAGLGTAAYTDSTAYDAAGSADTVSEEIMAIIGEVTEGSTVVEMIAASEYDDTELANKVATLIGSDTDLSAREIAIAVLTEQLIPENASEALDTLQEIAAWIQSHPDDAAAMNDTISELEALVGTIPEDASADNIVAYIQEAVAAAQTSVTDSLADIATTGDAGDLTQTDGEYLILSCGSSTEVI